MANLSNIKRFGPTRVVTELTEGHVGKADTTDTALADYGIVPTVVFVRNDGWSLGCDGRTAYAAYKLWEGDWEIMMDLVNNRVFAF